MFSSFFLSSVYLLSLPRVLDPGEWTSVLFPTVSLEFRIVPGTLRELIFVGYEIHICWINKWRVVAFWVGYFSSEGYLDDGTKEISGWFAIFGNNWLFSSLRDKFPWPLFRYIYNNYYFLPKESESPKRVLDCEKQKPPCASASHGLEECLSSKEGWDIKDPTCGEFSRQGYPKTP